MRPPNQRPLEAVVLDDVPPLRPSGVWRTWLLALTAFAAFLGCSGLGIWGLSSLRQLGLSRDVRRDSLCYQWETPAERLDNIAASMNAATVGCSTNELRDLSRFFRRLVDALSIDDQDAFRELLDRNILAHRASLHPWAASAEDFDRLAIQEQLEYDVEGPGGWSDYSIVHVVWGPRRDEVVVYAVLADSRGSTTPFRWWLRRRSRSWLICDWEDLDYGYSQAARRALEQVVDEHPKGNNYWALSSTPHRVSDALALGDRSAARRELLSRRDLQAPEIAHDLLQLQMAFAWWQAGQHDEALATVAKLDEPELHAGAEYLKALVYDELDDTEQALAAAQQCHELAGCHPEALQIEARALEAAGRQAEAADCWWQLARLLPQKSAALAEFSRLATDEQRPRLKQALARARRPVDLAVQVGEAAVREQDDVSTEWILSWLREQAGGKLSAVLLEAAQRERGFDYVQVAALYREACKLATRSAQIEELERKLLHVMVTDDKVVEVYRELPQPRETFAALVAGIEDRDSLVTLDQLPALIAAHAERDAEDPRLHYAQAWLLMEEQKYADAEPLLAEGGKLAADGDLVALMRARHVECLYRLGQVSEALAGGDNPSETFGQLARLGRSDNDWPRLDRLLELYGKQTSEDPWLHYFRALRAQDQNNHSAALALLRGIDAADDVSLEYAVTRLKTELWKESGDLGQAYSSGGEPKEAFTSLVQGLIRDSNWDGVLSLTQIHAAVAPSDPAATYYAAMARWYKQDYAAVVSNLTPWPTDRLKDADSNWSAELAEWLVRSHLRLGKAPEARAAARHALNEFGDPLPLLLVELQENQTQAALKLLAGRTLARRVFQRELSDDQELAGLLSDPAFAEVRLRQPLDATQLSAIHRASFVLLFKGTADWEKAKETVQRLSGESAELSTLELSGEDPQRQTAIISLPRGKVLVTAARRPYCEPEAIATWLSAANPLRAAAQQHNGWIAVDLIGGANDSGASLHKLGQQIVAAVMSDALALGATPQALYVDDSASNSHWLLPANELTQAKLEGGSLLSSQTRASQATVLLFEAQPTNNEDKITIGRQKSLRSLLKAARVENPEGYGRVQFRLQGGHAADHPWLKVVRSQRNRYGDEFLIGELMAASPLWPHLKAGARLRIEGSQVENVESALSPETAAQAEPAP